jgi:hypothetical protein
MAISLNLYSEGKDIITQSMVTNFETAMLCSSTYGNTLDVPLGTAGDLLAKSADTIATRITLDWVTSNGSRTTNKPENSNGLIFPISANRTIRYLVLLQDAGGSNIVRGHFDLGAQTPTKVSAYVLDNISISL